MFSKIWDVIVRWRTALFNGIGVFLTAIAPLLGAPEILAIIPPNYIPYAMAAVFIINYWMRPRPAARAIDPEVKIAKLSKEGL